MEKIFNQLLDYFGINMDEYDYITRPLSVGDLHDPYEFEGMVEAVKICHNAINNKEKIVVYGDYDCDGVMSTSIITKAFLNLGYKIGYYLPSRYLDGYGITMEKAKQIVDKGYKILITVDNGIVAFEPIKYCKEHGMKVIIIDHHEALDELPEADAIIHPQVSHFSDLKSSAGFCSFMFSIALLEKVDPYLLTLGAMSVISDMMPLKEFNRDIVRLATLLYQDKHYYNIDLLKEDDEFNYQSIGMRIAPKINAIGRLIKDTKINQLIPYFISDDKELISRLYFWINENNENRKSLSQTSEIILSDEDKEKAGIVALTHCEEGLVGILANKLLNEYKKPVVVLTVSSQDNNILQGSCRALEGFNIVKCFEDLQDILLNAGGHALAGGLSLKAENLEEFKIRFNKSCIDHPPVDVIERTIDINIQDISLSTYRLVDTFSPFGEEWKAPIFGLKHVKTSSLIFSRNNEHILTPISNNSKLVGFNHPRKEVQENNFIDITGLLNYYVYHGIGGVQFVIKKIKPNKD